MFIYSYHYPIQQWPNIRLRWPITRPLYVHIVFIADSTTCPLWLLFWPTQHSKRSRLSGPWLLSFICCATDLSLSLCGIYVYDYIQVDTTVYYNLLHISLCRFVCANCKRDDNKYWQEGVLIGNTNHMNHDWWRPFGFIDAGYENLVFFSEICQIAAAAAAVHNATDVIVRLVTEASKSRPPSLPKRRQTGIVRARIAKKTEQSQADYPW